MWCLAAAGALVTSELHSSLPSQRCGGACNRLIMDWTSGGVAWIAQLTTQASLALIIMPQPALEYLRARAQAPAAGSGGSPSLPGVRPVRQPHQRALRGGQRPHHEFRGREMWHAHPHLPYGADMPLIRATNVATAASAISAARVDVSVAAHTAAANVCRGQVPMTAVSPEDLHSKSATPYRDCSDQSALQLAWTVPDTRAAICIV